jgi:hypothetical protein
MTAQNNSSSAPVSAATEAAPASSNAATGGAQTSAQSSTPTSFTGIRSLSDLREQSPALYNMMMQGIAMNICNEMQKQQARLKQMMRQGESGG